MADRPARGVPERPDQTPEIDPEGAPPVPDAARAVLSRIRSAARSAPGRDLVRSSRATPVRARGRRGPGGFSGPGPDDRDPMALGAAWGNLVADQGWSRELDVARLIGLWPQIVGSANAEHAQPESFDPHSGTLLIRTSSTAWAEQLKLMMPVLRGAIDGQVGTGVVRAVQVVGPAPPPRRGGRLRVRGRGPRDTYG